MFSFRETMFSGKNAISKNVEEKTCYLPKAGFKITSDMNSNGVFMKNFLNSCNRVK
jgi:hypothetical protein